MYQIQTWITEEKRSINQEEKQSTENSDSEYYHKVKKRKCKVSSSKRIEKTKDSSSESDYQKL